MRTEDLWSRHAFSLETSELCWDLPTLQVLIIRQDKDLLLRERKIHADAASEKKAPTKEEESAVSRNDFRRFAFDGAVEAIHVLPATPDRPIVVGPQQPLILAVGTHVEFFVSFPCDLSLETEIQEKRIPMAQIRSEILSDTWFGDQMGGVLCYALKSRARRDPPAAGVASLARAICNIKIFNASSEQLDFRKFCLRLCHCHLWRSGSQLWTSPVNIRFQGLTKISEIDYSEDPPPELEKPQLITEAPQPPTRGLIRRTFERAGLSNQLF